MNLKQLAINGLKIVSAIIGGCSIFSGISKLIDSFSGKQKTNEGELPTTNDNSSESSEFNDSNINDCYDYEDNDNNELSMSQRIEDNSIVRNIRKGQIALTGLVKIIEGITSVARSISNIFNPNYYRPSSLLNNYPDYLYSPNPYGPDISGDLPSYNGYDPSTGNPTRFVRDGNVIRYWW